MTSQRRPAALAFIFATVLLDVLGLGIIIPVLPHLVADMVHEDTATAAIFYGLLASTYAVMQLIFAPVLGALSDRFGRRPILLLSLLGMSASYLIMAMAPNLAWLFVARAFSGITGASFTTAYAYIADVSPPEKRAQSFGLIGVAFGLGFIVGPAAGGLLGHIDTRMPFYAAAAVTMCNLLYGLLILPESLPTHQRRNIVWRRANPLGGVLALRRYPSLLTLAIVFVSASMAQRGLESIWVLYSEHRYGWHELQNGMALTVVGISGAIVQGGLLKHVVARFGEQRTVLFGLSALATAMVLYGSASSSWMFVAAIPVAALGMLTFPTIQSLVSKSVPANEQGEVQGVLTSLMSLTAVGAPILASQLFAGFSSATAIVVLPGAPFFAGAIFCAVALAIAVRTFRRRPNFAPTENIDLDSSSGIIADAKPW